MLVFLWTPDKAGWYLQDVFSSSVGLPSDSIPVSSGRGLQASQDVDVKDGKQVIFRRKSHMTDMREVRMSGKNIQLYVCTSLFLLSVSISLVITSGDLPRSNPIAVLSHWRTVQSQEISRLSPVCLLSCHSTKSLENLASDTGTNTVLGEKKKKNGNTLLFSILSPFWSPSKGKCQTLGLLIKNTSEHLQLVLWYWTLHSVGNAVGRKICIWLFTSSGWNALIPVAGELAEMLRTGAFATVHQCFLNSASCL